MTARGVRIAGLAGVLAAGCGGQASAQTVAPSRLAFEVGELSVRDEDEYRDGLELGGRARVIYDTNFLRLDEGVDVAAGRSRDDLITSVAAVVRAQISPSLQRLFVSAEYGRVYYAQNDFLKGRAAAVQAGWDWRITPRCGGQIRADYAEAQADLAEQGAAIANLRRVTAASAGGGCRIGLGFLPSVSVAQRDSENSNPARRGIDFETRTLRTELAYNRTGKAGVAVGYRTDRFDFPNRLAPDGLAPARTGRDAVGARFDLELAERSDFSLFVDHNWVDPRGNRQRREWSGGFVTRYRPIPRVRLAATARRDIDVPIFVAASYVVRDRAELAGGYAISPRTLLQLRAGVERNRYRDRVLAAGADIRTGDRTVFVGAEADYRLFRGVDLGLNASYGDRNANGPFGTFAGARVALGVRVVR